MKQVITAVLLSSCLTTGVVAQAKKDTAHSGNPLFKGWYADPEAIIFNKQYWIFPTYSAPYSKQVFFDAFSSKDLVTWTKHERIMDTAAIKWAKRAVWAPSIIEKKNKYYLFFGANDIQNNNEYGDERSDRSGWNLFAQKL